MRKEVNEEGRKRGRTEMRKEGNEEGRNVMEGNLK
jgi:hypothetical protein